MESGLPLLEISDEDDSLLLPQQIHSANVADVRSNYFSCSPLQFKGPRPPHAIPPRPSPLGVAEENLKKLSSFSMDKSNKENDEVNKSETPKLGMDPQLMKRKTKGGSYNLRKSLAWNNAFFTEEGVLDPFELSLISGAVIDSSGDALSAMKEEGCSIPVPQRKTLMKFSSPVVGKSKRVGTATMSKCDSPDRVNLAPRPVATRKVLSTHGINRSGLMNNGSRPSPSSSQKRPANANITRIPMRESKLPKHPAAKPDSSALPKVAKSSSLVAARPKNDQIVHCENVPKMTGFKGSVRNYRSDRSTAKAAASDKYQASSPSSKKVTMNSLAKVPSSSTPKPLVGRVDNGVPKIIPDPILPPKGSTFDESTKLAFAAAPNIKCAAGGIPKAQPQSAKPTFLRMPSPSIGYFGQPKASTPQSLLSRISQACNTVESTSDSQKLDVIGPINAQKPPLAPRRKQKFTRDLATAERSRGSSKSIERHVLTEADTSLSSMSSERLVLTEADTCLSSMNSKRHALNEVDVSVSSMSSERHVLTDADTSLSSMSSERHVLNEADTSLPGSGRTDVGGHCSKKIEVRVPSLQSSSSILENVEELSKECPGTFNMEEVSCNVDVKLHVKSSNPLPAVSCELFEAVNDQKNVADICLEVQNPSLEKVTDVHIPSPSCLLVYEDNHHNVYTDDQSNTSLLECQDFSSHLVPEGYLYLSRDLQGTEDETFYCHEAADNLLSDEDHVLSLGTRSCEDSGEYEMEHCNAVSQSLNYCSQSQSQPKYMRKPNENAVEEDVTVTNINLVDASIRSSSSNVQIQSCASKSGNPAVHVLATMSEGTTEESRKLGNSRGSVGVDYTKNDPTKEIMNDKLCQLAVQSSGHLREVHSGEAMICSNQNASAVIDIANDLHKANTLLFELEGFRTNQADEISHGLQPPKHDQGNSAEVGQCNDVSGRNDLDNSFDSSQHIRNQENEGITTVDNMTQELQIDSEVRSSDCNLLVENSNSANTSVILSYMNKNTVGRLLSQKPCAFLEISENTGSVLGTEPETDDISTYEEALELLPSQTIDEPARSVDIGLVEYQNADGDTKSVHEIGLIGLATSKCDIILNECQDQAVKSITHGRLTSSCDESQRSVQIDQISYQSEKDGRAAHRRSDIFLLEPETKGSDNVSSENQKLQKTSTGCLVSNISLHANVELVSLVVLSTGGSSSHENLNGPSRDIYKEQGNEGTSMELTTIESLHTGDTEEASLEHNLNAVSCCSWIDSLKENGISPAMTNISGEESVTLDQNDQSLANQRSPKQSSVSVFQSKDVPEVARNSHISTDGNLLQKLNNPLSPSGEETIIIKRSGKDVKKDVLTIKPPPNVVPFSDEWLAAVEAAGEDILTLKSGAVQHSPVDKPIPEPSPWSPVRKKNNQAIGPFDCTKYTNPQL